MRRRRNTRKSRNRQMITSLSNPRLSGPDPAPEHAARTVGPESNSSVAEGDLWLPPTRLAGYQGLKLLGGLCMIGLFGFWWIVQGANPVMRLLTSLLMLVTAWITLRSLVQDAVRSRGRQVQVLADRLRITQPGEPLHEIMLTDVDHARWLDDAEGQDGLTFLDRNGQPLGRLDRRMIDDEDEARAFLRFLRQRTDVRFEVHWPDVT